MQVVKNTIKFKTLKLLKRIDLSQEPMAALDHQPAAGAAGIGNLEDGDSNGACPGGRHTESHSGNVLDSQSVLKRGGVY